MSSSKSEYDGIANLAIGSILCASISLFYIHTNALKRCPRPPFLVVIAVREYNVAVKF